MQISRLHHVNISTHDIETMIQFYTQVFGFIHGERPAFSSAGAWLYLDDIPLIHFNSVAAEYQNLEPKLNHFAFSATGLQEFLDRLRAMDIPYQVLITPALETHQVNAYDPDGNLFEVIFARDEIADVSSYRWN